MLCKAATGGYKGDRSSIWSVRESELRIVPFGSQSSITLGEGRGNAFIEFLKEGRTGDCEMLKTPEMSGNFRGNYTRRPSRLRKPLEEDDRKAVCGKEQPTRLQSSWWESSRVNCPCRTRSDTTSRVG
jgi:hypothetical protein